MRMMAAPAVFPQKAESEEEVEEAGGGYGPDERPEEADGAAGGIDSVEVRGEQQVDRAGDDEHSRDEEEDEGIDSDSGYAHLERGIAQAARGWVFERRSRGCRRP